MEREPCDSHEEALLILAVSYAAGFRASLELSSRKRFRQDVPSVTKMALYNTLVVLYLA